MTTIAEQLEIMAAHNRAMFELSPRKVIVTRAGGFYRARYEGSSTSCLGYSRKDAVKKLKFFDGK